MQETPPKFETPITITTQTREMECPKCSYGNFVASFKKNWEHHMESLRQYNGDKKIGIFLIEQTGAPIIVKRNGSFSEFYRLEMDVELFSYMLEFKNEIRYVIFCYQEFCDVIDLSNVHSNTYNDDMTFDVGGLRQTNLSLIVDVSLNYNAKDNGDD